MRIDGVAKLDFLFVEVDAVDELLDGIGAGAALEVVAVLVAQFTPQHFVVEDLAAVQALELVPRTCDEVEFHLVTLAQRVHFLVGVALHLLGVGAVGLGRNGFGFEFLETTIDGEFEFLAHFVALGEVLGFKR